MPQVSFQREVGCSVGGPQLHLNPSNPAKGLAEPIVSANTARDRGHSSTLKAMGNMGIKQYGQ